MPRLSRFFVRAALLYLLLGFTFGGLILANKGIPFLPQVWVLLPLHIEFLIPGWLTQLALGVVFWILPRHSSGPPRGEERWSWAAFWLINAGILLYCLTPFLSLTWLGFFARALQAAGFAAFVAGNWTRIKPAGK